MQPFSATNHQYHQGRLNDALLHLVDFAIFGVIFVAPLFMGGRGPVGKFAFVSFVCFAGVAWSIRQCVYQRSCWRPSGVEWLLFLGFALLLLQLVPLSPSLLAVLSPSIAELLPVWSSTEGPWPSSSWSTVSLSPEATRGALVVFLSYTLLFLLLVQRIESHACVQRLLRWIALATIAMACLGLLQFLVGNGKFLWVFEHPSRDTFRTVKGPFHNQNHFAHMLALGIGPLIWLLWRNRSKRELGQLLLVGLGAVAVAGLLTFSRGGVISIAVAGVVCAGIYVWRSLFGKQALLAAMAMVAVITVALCIHGYEPLARRLATLRDSRSLEEVSHGREALWTAMCTAIPEFAILGAGIGSHREVYPIFLAEDFSVEFTHGENGYLQLLLEAGIPGLLLMLTGIVLCFHWCLSCLLPRVDSVGQGASRRRASGVDRNPPHVADQLEYSASLGAVFPGLVVSVVHSSGDFVWYISACMSLTVILAACACRLYQLTRVSRHSSNTADDIASRNADKSSRSIWRGLSCCRAFLQRQFFGQEQVISRRLSIVLAVSIAATAFVMVSHFHRAAFAAPHWCGYLRTVFATPDGASAAEADDRTRLYAMARHLEEALAVNPDDARANLRYAGVCLRRFELEQQHALNPMSLSQIREAALASQFPSKGAQQAWLEVAVGDNVQLLERAFRHCQRGLRACPLQGEGYVFLAELSFLDGPDRKAKHAYIGQAQHVRPHSARVLFAVGREAILAGDISSALEFWRRAFQKDPDIQALIIESFASQVPAEFFLKTFHPQADGLARLYNFYSDSNRTDDRRVVAVRFLEVLERDARAAEGKVASNTWYRAQGVCEFLGDMEKAVAWQTLAVELDPNHFAKRRTLATLLVKTERYGAAIKQLQWCLRRRPEAAGLSELLADATRRDLEQRRAAQAGEPVTHHQRR